MLHNYSKLQEKQKKKKKKKKKKKNKKKKKKRFDRSVCLLEQTVVGFLQSL